jgi:hypothetical protein
MELLCALLTGFFLWLFLFHWRRAALARARGVAGALLIEVKVGRRWLRGDRLWQRLFVASMLVLLILLVWLRASVGTLFDDFMIAYILAFILLTAFPPFRGDAPLELREHGIVRARPMEFMPWDKVVGCGWCDKRIGFSRLWPFDRGANRPDEIEAITAVAARFAPVYDVQGELIAEPDPAERAARTASPRSHFLWRFQFNLQSLLLLMVAVSCAASCYGLHYRRAHPQDAAIAKLDKFHPLAHRSGDDVWWLDFSACTVKPGDDDLVHLKGFPNLEDLSLDGSPITDAGLEHLRTLKTLKRVSLGNTQVTQRGLDDLQEALPNATISCYPPPAAVAKPSAKGQ